MIIRDNARIISNDLIAENIYRIEIFSPEISKISKPGQFVNVRLSSNLDPLLRRPFSIHNVSDETLQIVFNVIGKGTKILSNLKPNDKIDIIGPLGNFFNLEDDFDTAIIVAGGLGVAPFPFLTKALKERKKHIVSLIGARTQNQIVHHGLENVHIATEDGSAGYKGTVIELFRSIILEDKIEKRFLTLKIFGCGPVLMIKALATLCNELNFNCEVAIEAPMACGIGLCQGCAVKSKHYGYKLACKDGPVFNSKEIIL